MDENTTVNENIVNNDPSSFSISSDYLVPNVANKEDYTRYKIRIFKSVPANTSLVCSNKFTGSVKKRGVGLKVIFPWVTSKLVSLASKTVNYPEDIYKTLDGIQVTIDFALTIQITDPVAFEINSQNPLQEVGSLAVDLMRSYVAGKTAEDLYKSTINLADIDPDGRLHDNAERTGVDVKNFYVKNIELPKSMKDDFEKKVAAQKEKEIAEINVETSKYEAEAAFQQDKKKMEIELEKLRNMIKILAQNGFSKEQIANYLRTSQFANGTAQVIANLNGRESDVSALNAASVVSNAVRGSNTPEIKNENNQEGNGRSRTR